MRIAIYARKSRKSDTGEALDTQIKKCQQYIELHHDIDNCTITVFEDDGFSGGNTERPKFQSLLREIELGNFDLLVCYRLDRISRSLSDFMQTWDSLEQHNVQFASVTESFDTSTPMGRAMLKISMVFAELERETIRERIIDNIYSLSKDGKWLGGTTPLGYKSMKQSYFNGTRDKICHILELDEFAPTVKLIYTKFLELGSLSKTVRFLNASGVTNKNGNPFSSDKLSRILTNPTYCPADEQAYMYFTDLGCDVQFDLDSCNNAVGILPFNRTNKQSNTKLNPPSEWIIALSYHKPIVTSDVWIKSQELVLNCQELAFEKGNGRQSSIALLTGLIYCKSCGARLLATNQVPLADGSISFVYRCETKRNSRGKDCNIENARGHILDPFIIKQLESLYKDKEKFVAMLKSQRNVLFENNVSQLDVKENLEKEIKLISTKIDNLLDSLSDAPNDLVKQSIYNKLTAFTQEQNELQSKLDTITSIISSSSSDLKEIDEIVKRLDDIHASMSDASFSEKKLLLSALIEKIEWDGSNIDIILRTHKSPSEINRNYIMESKITSS